MIAVCDTASFQLHSLDTDPNGRFLIITATINFCMTLVNIYALNTNQKSFMKSLFSRLQPHKTNPIVICGDFNEVMHPSIVSTSLTRRSPSSLQLLTSQEDLFDPWRYIHSNEKAFTFYSSSHRVYLRIYLFLVDKFTLQKVASTSIGMITWSNRAPITLELCLSQ